LSNLSGNEEEAARWFAMERRGVMTLDERAKLAVWRADPANAAVIAELENIWEFVEAAKDQIGSETLAASPGRYTKVARSALIALLCVVSLGLGVISYGGDNGFWTKLDWVER